MAVKRMLVAVIGGMVALGGVQLAAVSPAAAATTKYAAIGARCTKNTVYCPQYS